MYKDEPLHGNIDTLAVNVTQLCLQTVEQDQSGITVRLGRLADKIDQQISLEVRTKVSIVLQFIDLSVEAKIHHGFVQLTITSYIEFIGMGNQYQFLLVMLKQQLQGKSIAIIGYQTATGRILLKKILQKCPKLPNIIAIEIGKDHQKRSKFLADQYFTPEERSILTSRLAFIPLENIQEVVEKYASQRIDILFTLLEPIDFSNMDKVIDYHLINTSKIAVALEKIKVKKIVHLSSIYGREPGYVSEEDQLDVNQFRHKFTQKQEAAQYLKDNFVSTVEAWRWSIDFIEKSYTRVAQSIVILRVPSLGPTIIGFEGWTARFNYFTYMMYQIGTGLIKNLDGNKLNKLDIIPNDYAVNLLLVLSVRNTELKAQTINLSTSTRNYITLQQYLTYCQDAWEEYETKSPKATITQSNLGRKIKHASELFPSEVKKRVGSWFDVKSWKIEGNRAQHETLQKIQLINKYKYFLTQQWLCESIKSIDIFNQLSPQDQQTFDFNVNSINWRAYVKLGVYSIKKHLLNQHVESFKPQNLNLLNNQNTHYFSDIMWAMKEGKSARGLSSKQAVQFVLNSKSVKQAIKSLVQEQMLKIEGPAVSYEKAEQDLAKAAEQMCVQMFSDYSMTSLRMFAWFLHKVFGTIYQRVVVDKAALAKIQSHNENQGPLIIIPTHRSYIDFLIMSYVFFGNGIKCPHIAAAEDFLNMAVIHILLRKSGAFFIKRNQKKYRDLYKAIMSEYISKLMANNHYMEFFIEGTRSRTGKMLSPKFGILSLVATNVSEGKVADAHILPVTINYQRVLEGNSFTYEMMGQAKVKQSLSRLLKAADVLKENYGRIYIELCETISVKQWLNTQPGKFPQKMAKLGDKIVDDLSKKLVISCPAIVSSIVLMNRKGISDDSLQEKSTWLCKQISSRGIKITRSQADSSISVSNTLSLLQGILEKSKKDMFEVQVSFDQNSFMKLFTLTYYRNTLTHIFFQEAVVATALASFGHHNIITKSTHVEELFKQSCFLWQLLQNQFYLPVPLTKRERFDEVIAILVQKGILKIQEGFAIGMNLTGNYFNFYWSLVWPVVESYWITCLYLFKLLKNAIAIPAPKFMTQIQWFGQSLINERISTHLESISSDTIKNAVAIFTKMKLIVNVKQEYNGEQASLIKIGVKEAELRTILDRIEVFLKSSYAKSIKGILESGQGSVNIDFPFLSKL